MSSAFGVVTNALARGTVLAAFGVVTDVLRAAASPQAGQAPEGRRRPALWTPDGPCRSALRASLARQGTGGRGVKLGRSRACGASHVLKHTPRKAPPLHCHAAATSQGEDRGALRRAARSAVPFNPVDDAAAWRCGSGNSEARVRGRGLLAQRARSPEFRAEAADVAPRKGSPLQRAVVVGSRGIQGVRRDSPLGALPRPERLGAARERINPQIAQGDARISPASLYRWRAAGSPALPARSAVLFNPVDDAAAPLCGNGVFGHACLRPNSKSSAEFRGSAVAAMRCQGSPRTRAVIVGSRGPQGVRRDSPLGALPRPERLGAARERISPQWQQRAASTGHHNTPCAKQHPACAPEL